MAETCATCKRSVEAWRYCIGCGLPFCPDCIWCRKVTITRSDLEVEAHGSFCSICAKGVHLPEDDE